MRIFPILFVLFLAGSLRASTSADLEALIPHAGKTTLPGAEFDGDGAELGLSNSENDRRDFSRMTIVHEHRYPTPLFLRLSGLTVCLGITTVCLSEFRMGSAATPEWRIYWSWLTNLTAGGTILSLLGVAAAGAAEFLWPDRATSTYKSQ